MKTRRIYHEDPEARAFDARVESCRPGPAGFQDVVLDQTAFYPTGGGQPHDTGLLGGRMVTDVFEEGGRIVHRIRGDAVSDRVEAEVDWRRRLDHRQQHTGQHILSRAFLDLESAMTVGFHLGQDTCTIDLDREVTEEGISNGERRANEVVLSDVDIVDRWYEDPSQLPSGLRKEPAQDGPIRILFIGTFDATPCGGTHCRRSGQVGQIKVLGSERRRGGSRIEFVCGYRALEDYGRRHKALQDAARMLSTEDLRVPVRVRGLLDELKTERARAEIAEGAIRERWLERLSAEAPGPLARVLDDARFEWLSPLAASLAERRVAPVMLALKEGAEGRVVLALPAGSTRHAGNSLRELLAAVGGRGGGAERSAQGKIPAESLPRLLQRWMESVS
ncbi:MAG TPA: alanyl-tRNA editing protein [Candidatus Eisenbacteria bacterium]|nr:alanyl-tRNA editing protein [Candidatus Eisenbacteria bacterium]